MRARQRFYGLAKNVESYPNEDEQGRYASTDLTVGMGKDARPGQFYPSRIRARAKNFRQTLSEFGDSGPNHGTGY